jgi:hypothetical protein
MVVLKIHKEIEGRNLEEWIRMINNYRVWRRRWELAKIMMLLNVVKIIYSPATCTLHWQWEYMIWLSELHDASAYPSEAPVLHSLTLRLQKCSVLTALYIVPFRLCSIRHKHFPHLSLFQINVITILYYGCVFYNHSK